LQQVQTFQTRSQADRPTAAGQRLTQAKQRQQEIAAELKLPAPEDELPALTEARRWMLAYESDVQKAMSPMLEAAEEHERVLSGPNPVVTFDDFGDIALALTLRAYVGALEHRLPTITELHHEINRKFNEAGAVIAFPQRDLHMNTSRPLDIRIRHGSEQRNTDDSGRRRG
jgi:hypothetical protein